MTHWTKLLGAEGGRFGSIIFWLDGAFALGAAVQIDVHEAAFLIGEELFIKVFFATACCDFTSDDSEASTEFIDEAEQRGSMNQLGARIEEVGR